MSRPPKVEIRWIRSREHTDVAMLQRRAYHSYTSVEAVDEFSRHANHIPKVLLVDNKVIGCNFYALHSKFILIHWLKVAEEQQGLGYEVQMINELKRELANLHRCLIAVILREDDLASQLLFKKCGFKWCRTFKYHNESQDYYVLKFEAT